MVHGERRKNAFTSTSTSVNATHYGLLSGAVKDP